MNKLKIYSPNQILLGSLYGGPLAVTYFLYRNYITLNNNKYAKQTILVGSLLTLILLVVYPFIPEDSSAKLIPLVIISSIGKQLAIKTQLSKDDIKNNKKYLFESNWKVFGMATLLLGISVVLSILVLLGLDFTNIINLNE